MPIIKINIDIICEVDSPPNPPRKSSRKNSIKKRPVLYKIKYIAPTVPVTEDFLDYKNKTRAIKNLPALEINWVGINGILFGAKSEWV